MKLTLVSIVFFDGRPRFFVTALSDIFIIKLKDFFIRNNTDNSEMKLYIK